MNQLTLENICSNCGEKNLVYEKNCNKCKHYLRATVVNIDLWSTFWKVFESPKKAFTNIIVAEHKNFVIFLVLILSIKLMLISLSIQSFYDLSQIYTNYFLLNILIHSTIFIVILLLFSIILTYLLRIKIRTRFKDNLSVLVFSFTPIIFSLVILTPVEYGIFGKHWFVYNPSPFLIKETLAYIILGLEVLMVIWSLVNLYIGLRIQTTSKLYSILGTLVFVGIISAIILNIPYIII